MLGVAIILVWQWGGVDQPPSLITPIPGPTSKLAESPAPPNATSIPPTSAPRQLIASRIAVQAKADEDHPRFDPDDLANYVSPTDPEPSMKEVIEGLHAAGIRTGLGAFNPPGTMPALAGIAVPDDFELPEGYVRHHQVTDEGEPIEPILMFSPDFDFMDANGEQIVLPEDLVVPPELAPPGLPIRQVPIPP